MSTDRGNIVLLALERAERPTSCVVDAVGLARQLGAELEVVRIVPQPILEGQTDRFIGSEAAEKLCLAQRESTVGWLTRVLGRSARSVHVVVLAGEFAEQAARWAQHKQVRLVLVSGETRQAGGVVTSLAREARRPVLGLRGLNTRRPILAATDMRDREFPVLWKAAELASSLETSLVTLHNLDPALIGRSHTPIPDVVLTGTAASPSARHTRLLDVGSLLAVPSMAVVRCDTDPAEAILSEAAARDVGLIALGTHYRSWWERLLAYSVAAEVVARSKRAVMVTPVGHPGHI